MGAADFRCRVKAPTARKAFAWAVEDAQFEYGDSGYTGTIADKHTFNQITVDPAVLTDPAALSAKVNELTQTRFKNKWGPAGCIKVAEGEYLFFGVSPT